MILETLWTLGRITTKEKQVRFFIHLTEAKWELNRSSKQNAVLLQEKDKSYLEEFKAKIQGKTKKKHKTDNGANAERIEICPETHLLTLWQS